MRKQRTKLHRTLIGKMDKAVRDFGLISSGDRIAVAVSGGPDSMSLLTLLCERVAVYGSDIGIVPIYVELGFSENPQKNLEYMDGFFCELAEDYHVEATDIGQYAHSEKNRKNPCFLCTRLRRKRVYEIADAKRCNKIALGHHKDDIIETFLLNVFYGREISTMVPKQSVFKGRFHIIRPLTYAWEIEIKAFANEIGLETLVNECPTEPASKRKFIKKLLVDLEEEYRGTKENIFKALKNVKTEYLL